VAVKKKATAKKTAKKAPAKKVAKKAVAKKSPAKKVAKKAVAKKAVAKKSPAKKVAKKATVKKSAVKKSAVKKTTAKKAVVKKATARKSAVKKSASKSSAASVVVPPVPTGASRDRVNVSTTPVAPKAAPATPKPSAAPRQGSSKSVLVAVLLGVAILAAIVLSQQTKNSDDVSPAPAVTESASPAASDSASPAASESASPETTASAASTGEAPSRFIGNWKSADHTTLVLSWRAPAASVTGYKVEIASNGGVWKELSQLPATQLSLDVTKTSDETYTSFRLSAIYSDGSLGTAKAFGFKGQFE
jgi:hypothetical protein